MLSLHLAKRKEEKYTMKVKDGRKKERHEGGSR